MLSTFIDVETLLPSQPIERLCAHLIALRDYAETYRGVLQRIESTGVEIAPVMIEPERFSWENFRATHPDPYSENPCFEGGLIFEHNHVYDDALILLEPRIGENEMDSIQRWLNFMARENGEEFGDPKTWQLAMVMHCCASAFLIRSALQVELMYGVDIRTGRPEPE